VSSVRCIRMLISLAACCAAAAMAIPTVAIARDGGVLARSQSARFTGPGDPQICPKIGSLVLDARSRFDRRAGDGLGEAQLQALQAACNKLAAAFEAERNADVAAGAAYQAAIAAARGQLSRACPQPSGPRRFDYATDRDFTIEPADSTGPIYKIPTPCEEARKAYDEAVDAADDALQQAREEAAQEFQTALEEFEATVQSVLGRG
jgi:hypothetical protein